MTGEFEVAAAASAGGLTKKRKADYSEQPCRNCGAMVEDRFCPACGQLAASFERPVWGLVGEVISDTMSLDGRLARTLPVLFFRPGRLTRSYIEGKRARYVPPFRLFLLASLLFFLVLFSVVPSGQWLQIDTGEDGFSINVGSADEEREVITSDGTYVPGSAARIAEEEGVDAVAEAEVIDNWLGAVIDNPRAFQSELESWVPRLTFLIVPLTVIALTLLHFWRRRLYIYDHAIHSLHLHTWLYLTATVTIGLSYLIGGWIWWIFLIWFVIYVVRSLKVVGQTGWIMSSLRFWFILIFWTISTSVLVLTSVLISGYMAQA